MNMESEDKRNKDSGNILQKYIKSFFHAIDGFKYAVTKEHNLIIMLMAVFVTITAGIYFQISEIEWLFCIISFAAVIATEMINTSIEAIVDLVTLEQKPLAKIAKDTASTASLIFSLMSLIIGLIIFLPKFIERF